MGREWKPGDVAMVGYRMYEDSDDLTHEVRILRCDGKWYGATGWVMNDPDVAVSIRPLVVIDPEDSEQVYRLVTLYWDVRKHDASRIGALTAALREFANPTPPKPDEPMDLGAVVEDADGGRWVRCDTSRRAWYQTTAARWWAWDELNIVRVLSEGVAE